MNATGASLLLAQVGAETRTRLRSTGTLVAVLAVLAASYAWIPAPSPYAASLTWGGENGPVMTGIYNSPYIGTASALLVSTILPFAGFYLVAGSISRDRRSGVGAILAATPLSNFTYLAGKIVAHTAYLLAVAASSFVSGALILLRYGEGNLQPAPFLLPWLVLVPPSLLMTAALAVFFDVTPGLRSKGGLVLWFFVWAFALLILPMMHIENNRPGLPVYDPTGFAWFGSMLRETTGLSLSNLSIGNISKEPMTRIVWEGLPLSLRSVSARLANCLWALVPLGAAVLLFDRFDPSRKGGLRWRPRIRATSHTTPEQPLLAEGNAAAATLAKAPLVLSAPIIRFDALGPYLAEARLIWESAGVLRWAVLGASLVALGPGEAAKAGAAAFVILMAPFLSEVAARERIAGAEGLVFALPSIPRSVALWKAGSVALVVLVLGTPMVIRAAMNSVSAGLCALLGLGFLVLWAVAAGLLTGGGKLFTGTVMILWYGALNGAGFLDFCGTLSGSASMSRSAAYLGFGAAALGMAELWERRKSARGR